MGRNKFGGIAAAVVYCVTVAHARQGGVDVLWEHSPTVSQTGPRDIGWVANDGLLFTNSARGGAEFDILTVADIEGSPSVWTAPNVEGDRLGRLSVSSDGRVSACLYRQDAPIGSGGSPTLALRIVSGYPTPTVHTVPTTIPTPEFEAGSYGVSVLGDGSSVRVFGYSLPVERTLLQTYSVTGVLQQSQQLTITGRIYGHATNADGTVLALQGPIATQVVRAGQNPGMQVLNQPVLVYGRIACTSSGSVLAWASGYGEVLVARRQANGTYVPSIGFDTAPLGYCTALALSDDGSTLAMGSSDNANVLTVRQQIYRLDATAATRVFDRVGQYSTAQHARVTDIDAGPDGARVIFANAGDAEGAHPELVAYRRNLDGAYGPVPEWSFQLPGSAVRVELNSSGNQMAVLQTLGHMDQATQWTARLYDLDSDIRALGVPHAGQTVQIDVDAQLGQRVALFRSGTLASPGSQLGFMGTLRLVDPILVGGMIGGVNGVARYDLALSSAVFPAGTTHHFQALRMNPRRLTQAVVSFTVVP